MPRMLRGPRWLVALALGGLIVLPTRSLGAERDPSGAWQGSLQGMLRISMRFERTIGGTWMGIMDSPDQGAMGMALDSVTFERDSLRCELRRVGGVYLARLGTRGDTLFGMWRQSGVSVPLDMVRGVAPMGTRRPQEMAPPYPYDTLEVSFDNVRDKGVRLAGTLSYPRGKGPFPVVLLITGSGLEDRDETVFGHRPFKVLADHLTRAGIAVLRVDDRGVGRSRGSNAGATTEMYASDALAGVEFLKRRPEVDKKRIGLVGHSEGGLIAPMVATRSKDVAFIVLLAGPGVRGDSLLLLQSAALRRALGVSEENLAREAEANRRVHAAMAAADSAALVRAVRALVDVQLASSPSAQRGSEADVQSLVDSAVRTCWDPWTRWLAAHDPAPVLQRVRVPVLAVNGSRDLQVTPRENLAAIERALQAGGNADHTVRELPGLNHLFQRCTSCTIAEYGQLEETFAPSALTVVSNWIRARMLPAK